MPTMDTNKLIIQGGGGLARYNPNHAMNHVKLFSYPNRVLGVKTSPYIMTDSEMMTISLLIPATLNVTVLVLLIKYSSANVIAKAGYKKLVRILFFSTWNIPLLPKNPPIDIKPKDSITWNILSKCSDSLNWSTGFSKIKLSSNMMTNMIGLRWYSVAIGLSIPKRSSWRRNCVRFHRKPETTAATSTRRNPTMSNFVSPSTVRMTPTTIKPMIATSRTRGFSKPKIKEKRRTQIGVLDLTIV